VFEKTRASAPKPAPKGGKASPAGAEFLRVDLTGKKADGGELGLAPKGAVRRMRCELGSKP
jgi:hypothetical protein